VLAIPLVIRQGTVASGLLGIGEVVGLVALVYLATRILAPRSFSRRARARSRDQHWALDLRMSLLILFVLAWVAVSRHTGILIAGFAAGAMLSVLGEPRRLAEQLIGLGEGFLVPLFFVTLGARIDLGALLGTPRNLVLAGVVAVGATGVHLAAALVFRLPPAVGLLATAQLGVPSAIVSVGLADGLLRPGQGAALLFAVLVSLGACAAGAAMLGHRDPLGDHTAPRIGGGVAPRPRRR
jgi:Kef-type K+ transport system membrane component KefB